MAIDIIGNLLMLVCASAMVGGVIGLFICIFITKIGSLFKKGFELSQSAINSIMIIIGIIAFGGFLIMLPYKGNSLSDPTITQSKIYTSIFDNTKVTDRQIERQEQADNSLTENEAINAVLYKYGVGSSIEGYTINTPTGYCQIGGSNNDSKRSFVVGFNLKNGRIGYVKGFVSKKNGKVKVQTDELILE